jgi:hypothetical protein
VPGWEATNESPEGGTFGTRTVGAAGVFWMEALGRDEEEEVLFFFFFICFQRLSGERAGKAREVSSLFRWGQEGRA